VDLNEKEKTPFHCDVFTKVLDITKAGKGDCIKGTSKWPDACRIIDNSGQKDRFRIGPGDLVVVYSPTAGTSYSSQGILGAKSDTGIVPRRDSNQNSTLKNFRTFSNQIKE
jgi:hypothetical protein